MTERITDEVRTFWEKEPCGTGSEVTGATTKLTREWFEQVEEYRYAREPEIHAVAQFTRWHGKELLEVGVGAGTDHLQWARAGALCHGVDLTDAAIETTRQRLALYGFSSDLQRANSERLPYESNTFDVVYSWGVIHHADHPEEIIREIQRVLKPGGTFIGMMYGSRSMVVLKLWVKHALLKGRPWTSPAQVVWNHMESIGTKAYTVRELNALFVGFRSVHAKPVLTFYDRKWFPKCISRFFPDDWGWFITLKAVKQA